MGSIFQRAHPAIQELLNTRVLMISAPSLLETFCKRLYIADTNTGGL